MKAKLFLRVPAILMFVHGAGHTIGQTGWKKSADPIQQEVIRQMTGPKFLFMGRMHSMGDYFDGYSYAGSAGLLCIILVLWFVSTELNAGSRLIKKLILTAAICLLLWGIVEIIFFFPFAAAVTLVSSCCTFIAWYLFSTQQKDATALS